MNHPCPAKVWDGALYELDGKCRPAELAAATAGTADLAGHEGAVSCLCPLPDGRLATAGDDGWLRVWDAPREYAAAAPACVALRGHASPILDVQALSDGRLASGGLDKLVRVWNDVRNLDGRSVRDVLRDADLESFALRGHGHRVTCLCLLPDGRVASGSGDASVRVSEPRLMNPVLELITNCYEYGDVRPSRSRWCRGPRRGARARAARSGSAAPCRCPCRRGSRRSSSARPAAPR